MKSRKLVVCFIVALVWFAAPLFAQVPQIQVGAPNSIYSYYGMCCLSNGFTIAAQFSLSNSTYVSTINVYLFSASIFDFTLQTSLSSPATTLARSVITTTNSSGSGQNTGVINVNAVLPAGTYYIAGIEDPASTTVVPGWYESDGNFVTTGGTVTNGAWFGSRNSAGATTWTFQSSGCGTTGNAPCPTPAFAVFGAQASTNNNCTFALSSSSTTVGPAATTGSLTVTTQSGCSFTASAPSGSFATISNGPNYTGTSTVTYSVAANSGSARTTSLTIAGQPYVINQLNGCVFGLTPSNASFPSSGVTSAIINVGGASATCPFTAVSNNPSFIMVNSIGPGSVNYTVFPNASSSGRTGTITVAGQTFTVVEAGTACSFALGQSTQTFTAAGGTGSTTVSAPAGCTWSAQSNSPFLTITGGSPGSGDGTVTYAVQANSLTAQRTGTLTIAGLPYAVTESGTAGVVKPNGIPVSLSCTASVPAAAQVAIEGRTEILGDLLLNCTGLGSTLTADITLALNTSVTNTITAGTTDASLLVNGAAPSFAGVVSGYNTLAWLGVPLVGSGGSVTLRITNVRADASLLGSTASLQSIPMTGLVKVSAGGLPVPIAGASEIMAYAAPTLVFQKGTPIVSEGGVQTTIPLQFQEAGIAAFHVASAQVPGSTSTRLRMVLTNIPANVQVFAPVFPNEGSTKAQLLSSSNPDGSAGTLASGIAGSLQQLTITAGTATATWLVLSADPTQFETDTFPLSLSSPANTDLSQIQVAGSLGPVSTVSIASATAAVPRFRDFSVPQALVNLRSTILVLLPPAASATSHLKLTSRQATPIAGSRAIFNNQVTNDNQDTPATDVVIGSRVTGGTITSCQTTIGSCPPPPYTDQVLVNVGTLAPMAVVSVTVTVLPAVCTADTCEVEEDVSTLSDQPTADLSASTSSGFFQYSPSPPSLGTSGTPQSTLVGTAFANPLQVILTDLLGNPMANQTVTFTAPGSGPSATLSATTVLTNSSGVASVTATANLIAGNYSVTASVSGLTAFFNLTNLPPSPPPNGDLAQNQIAAQSSTLPGTPSASVAVDGKTDGNFNDGSVTATNLEANPWWQVDLGSSVTVGSVVVWNRTDCCASRLGDYWVFVSNTPFLASDTPTTLQFRAGTFASHQTNAPSPSATITVGASGRYVRVQLTNPNYLSLAEVQVFGSTGPVASESSQLPTSPPANVAIDGITDGNYFDGSVTATNLEPNPWWQEDLGASTAINSITIWNRTDCCGSRLNDYWVFVSNTPFLASDTPATLQFRAGTFASHQTTAPNPSTNILVGSSGRYVRIQLSNPNYLSLAEVQIQTGSSNPDLAFGKVATQSSTLPGTPSASVAVDGITDGNFNDGSVTATNLEANPWWQVDLGASMGVTTVVVWNRTDCCASRLNDYWVFLSDTPFLPTDTPTTLQNRAGTFAFHQTSAPNPSTTISTIVNNCPPTGIVCPLSGATAIILPVGRYIRIQLTNPNYLSLAEVQVYGPGGAPPVKVASESSQLPGSPPASAAIDGNTDGNFFDGSVTATNADPNAWWQVDLGATTTINTITIWNRTDCCATRLSDYWVFVSNSPFLATDTPTSSSVTPVFAIHQTTAPNPSVTIPVGLPGRYVRVQLNGTNYLSLAEVQVQ